MHKLFLILAQTGNYRLAVRLKISQTCHSNFELSQPLEYMCVILEKVNLFEGATFFNRIRHLLRPPTLT